jgi:3-hydroxy-5-methyl-1-naphthoate 3-O-methyltransferase
MPSETPQFPDPGPIMALSTAFWQAQTLLTANRIGLFATLAGETLTLAAIAATLGTAERPTRLLLKACVGLGLLEETSDGFRNSPAARAFLVPGTPAFLGNAIRYSDNLYGTWGRLDAALREDCPQLVVESYLGGDLGRTRDFVYGMHNRALGVGRALVGLVDLTGRERLLDVGGGPGTYSALFAQRHPDLTSTVLDLPDVVAIAAEIIASFGVADRVQTLAGDYKVTHFPTDNHVVLISGVLHRESEATCRSLIARTREALKPGGLLVVSDVMTDASGATPEFAALFGLNMLLTAEDGGVHSDADVQTWMREAGYQGVEARPFPPPMPHRVVLGVRP